MLEANIASSFILNYIQITKTLHWKCTLKFLLDEL